MEIRISGLVLTALLYSSFAFAQTNTQQQLLKAQNKDSSDKKERRVVIAGMLIGRFTQSFDKDVDINGRYHTEETGYSTSSFTLRRARILAKAQLTSRADAALSLNLTDFIGNPSNKVVENAFAKYHFNNYLNLQIGQFRPYFGREDLYGEELLQTFEWSNQYYAFGADGWQSFQVGATAFGK
ncbi:MAG TPA: porin, partial [Flavisolibacter sp.]